MTTTNQIVDRFCRYNVSDLGTAAIERASSVSIQRRMFPGVPGSLACLVSYDTVIAVQVGDLFVLNGTRYSVTTSKVQNRDTLTEIVRAIGGDACESVYVGDDGMIYVGGWES